MVGLILTRKRKSVAAFQPFAKVLGKDGDSTAGIIPLFSILQGDWGWSIPGERREASPRCCP